MVLSFSFSSLSPPPPSSRLETSFSSLSSSPCYTHTHAHTTVHAASASLPYLIRLIDSSRAVDTEPPPLALPTPTITATAPSPPPSQPPLATVNTPNPHLGETLGLQRRQHSRYIGLSSPFDSLLIGLTATLPSEEDADAFHC